MTPSAYWWTLVAALSICPAREFPVSLFSFLFPFFLSLSPLIFFYLLLLLIAVLLLLPVLLLAATVFLFILFFSLLLRPRSFLASILYIFPFHFWVSLPRSRGRLCVSPAPFLFDVTGARLTRGSHRVLAVEHISLSFSFNRMPATLASSCKRPSLSVPVRDARARTRLRAYASTLA